MPHPALSLYVRRLSESLRAGDATERTYYRALQELLEGIDDRVAAVVEPKRIECGAPDIRVRVGDLTIGYLEAKDVGTSLDAVEESEQLKDHYLKALPNLVLTDCLEFRWYADGERRVLARLGRRSADGDIRTTAAGRREVAALLQEFLSRTPQGALNARDLAERLAGLAKGIRRLVLGGLGKGYVSRDIRDLLAAIQHDLVPDLSDADFADMFAQTVAYGLFAAWCHHPEGRPFERSAAAAEIPRTSPLLRRLLASITGPDLDDEPYADYVDAAVALLAHTDRAAILDDFVRRTNREDPVVHFYETFLQAYDADLRELRGVYYTPGAVVSFMVRAVDELLRTRFGCPQGLADTSEVEYQRGNNDGQHVSMKGPRVVILDPACGTGTFLYTIITHVHDQLGRESVRGAWSSYLQKRLLNRLFGFELLMAPYAVAHLNLGLKLAGHGRPDKEREEWRYEFSGDERLGVFLTNTLERAIHRVESLPGLYRAITEEGNAAAEIKRNRPIMVVIGNPPYSGHSANRSWETINGQRARTFIGQLVQDYYQVDGQPLGERNPKWLQDDYVKFIRFGQWRIERTAQDTGGGGILALITNHSYLDNPTFRGMRQQLMTAFSEIYLLDLHGSTRRREKAPDGSPDQNIFDIQQGVAIGIFVKAPGTAGPARVWHADLWGPREAKEGALRESGLQDIPWRELAPRSPQYLFVPQDTGLMDEYQQGWSVAAILPVNSVGIVTARDRLTIHFTPEDVLATVTDFVSLDPETARDNYGLGDDARDWKVSLAQEDLRQSGLSDRLVKPVLYRPFDIRHTYYTGNTRGFICMPRREIMRHMLAGGNMGLIVPRRVETAGPWKHCLATLTMIGHVALSGKTIDSLLPLYLYPDADEGEQTISREKMIEEYKRLLRGNAGGERQCEVMEVVTRLYPEEEYSRWPNLDPFLLAELETRLGLRFVPNERGDLEATFGPRDVFNYAYALLHSPTYRQRYAEFLKRDYPRVPLPSDRALFAALARKGSELVALHLMESPLLQDPRVAYNVPGSNRVLRVHYDAAAERVFINRSQCFEPVPSEVWRFQVGGYQVCDKWLKDRKGRELTFHELDQYRRIVATLRHTLRLMAEVDALIPAWPIA